MNHYRLLTENLKKHGIIKKTMDELERKHIYSFLLKFSSRIDLLESFISEHTDYDGQKVHYAKYGEEKDNWLKNDNTKRQRDSKSDKKAKK